MDFMRIRALGVRCLVCCLDDDELEFLGVPWPDYSKASQKAGLDVLRIPTPEGLAPLTPAELDQHLTQLINMYTLRGIPMLVHCRGGVGRAGVFACTWLLRLGLCGWIETDPGGAGTPASLRRDTIQLVNRVIGVVRRRRSIKAVETYEQVQYLVDYVEYLRAKDRN
jgi:protein-tyrosine phosphatase